MKQGNPMSIRTLLKAAALAAMAFLALGPASAQQAPTPAGYSSLGGQVSLNATTSSSNIALPSSTTAFGAVTVFNKGTNDVHVALGGSGVVATTSSVTVVAGTSYTFWVNSPGSGVVGGPNTYIAGITASGSATILVYQASGPVNLDAAGAAVSNSPIPPGSNTIGSVYGYGSSTASSITRPANTTTYTANTGWCGATSACATVFSWSTACRASGTAILIPEVDIYSSANPTLKLQGILWLFSSTPGTVINDDATFNIASADFANLTGGSTNGLAFTLASSQASGAANSGVSLTGATYEAHCNGGTTLYGVVQVVNAYVPASGEVLTVKLRTVGVN